MILLVDNYDSFTYNLVHLFEELGAEVVVRRNDEIDADDAERLAPSHLVISPGPGRPESSGATVEIVRRLAPASSGRPGPGETTRWEGPSASASSGVSSSLRRTTTSAPRSANRCARL